MKDNDNLTIERPTFVTHLECAMEGDHYPADQIHNLSKAGKPLLVRYDLAGVKKALTKDALAQRPGDLWRYRELLPVRKVTDIVSLGEVTTPLIRLPKLSKKIGGGEIIVKDEGRLPTGSFKARGLVMAVSMGKALGIKHMAMPTNGNAGAALAAYATSCGIKTTIFCPADTPEVNVSEIELQGATVYRVNGLIDDCGKIVAEGKTKAGWFDTFDFLKEPYRIEGKKTMGLELATEQLLAGRCADGCIFLSGPAWRHRPDRNVEGICRTRSHRLHRLETPADGGGAGRRLRADGARLRAGHRTRRALGRRPHHRVGNPRSPGDRRLSDFARGAREQRFCHCGDG